MADSSPYPRQFPTTHWSLVERAAADDPVERRRALDSLLRAYLPALKAHLVRRHIQPADADDLLQDFVTKKLLDKDILALANPARGKFRSLLLTCLNRLTIDHYRKARRHVEQQLPSESFGPPGTSNADSVFDEDWAKLVLLRVLREVKRECDATDKQTIWFAFVERLIKPLIHGSEPPAYDALRKTGRFKSTKHVRNALVTAKRKFNKSLQQVVGEYVRSEEDIKDEIASLKSFIARAKSIDISLADL